MPDPLCPFGDGRHKRQPWEVREHRDLTRRGKGIVTRSGLVCMACGKTWEHVGKELVGTYDLMERLHLIANRGGE